MYHSNKLKDFKNAIHVTHMFLDCNTCQHTQQTMSGKIISKIKNRIPDKVLHVFENELYFLLFLHKNISCGYVVGILECLGTRRPF